MANRFIPYVPKPANIKYSSKPPYENVSSSIFKDSLQVEQNSVSSSRGICKSNNTSNEDVYDSEFPLVPEVVSNFWKEHAQRSSGCASKAIGRSALDQSSHSINSAETVLGFNLGDSQDKPILVREGDQDDTNSGVDLSNYYKGSTKSNTGRLDSRQSSLDTTNSLRSLPPGRDISCTESRIAKLYNTKELVTERASVKRLSRQPKHRARNIQKQSPSDLLQSQDSSTDIDSDSETESESDRPVRKKQKANNSQYSIHYRHMSLPKEDRDVVAAPQSRANDSSHSPHVTPTSAVTATQDPVTAVDDQSATFIRSASMISESNDPGRPQQMVEVADGRQEWEIYDIIGKEEVNGELHYWVEWSATLVPKCDLGNAKGLVDKFEAKLQCRQRDGERRGRLPLAKAGKQAIAGACETQQKKRRGRPRKQV